MHSLGFLRKEPMTTVVMVVAMLTSYGFGVVLSDLTFEQGFMRSEFWKKRHREWVEYGLKRSQIEKNQSQALMEEIKLLGATAPVDADRYDLVNEAARKVFNRSS